MKKKLNSIMGEMKGRTKIAIAISLLVVSVIAAGVIFNWDRLSGGSSAKADYATNGDTSGDNANLETLHNTFLDSTASSSASSETISAAEQDALNHIGGGPTTSTFQQKVMLLYRLQQQWPSLSSSDHFYNFKAKNWTSCPLLTGDVSNTEWVMDSTGCAVKKGSTSITNTIIPTTPEPTGCQQCDSNIVCSCNCS
jgi:hypothetical protein